MRILQVCFSPFKNSFGGVNKVLCNLSNHFCDTNEVLNVCCDGYEGKPFYHLDDRCKLIDLVDSEIKIPRSIKVQSEIIRLLKQIGLLNCELPKDTYRLKLVRRRFSEIVLDFQPDVILCYSHVILPLIADIGFDLKKTIVMFHSKVKVEYLNNNQRDLLKQVGCIQVLLESAKITLEKAGYKRIEVIGNAVAEPRDKRIDFSKKEKIIYYLGRMDKKVKRPHMLIKAFVKIADQFPDWKLILYGGEPSSSDYLVRLQKLINEHNLQERIYMPGISTNPLEDLRNGSVFVVTSSDEGFCLSLAEAMRMGLACIGFKSCSGVNELIIDGVNGLLCNDNLESLEKTMKIALSSQDLTNKLGKNAIASMEQFNKNIVFAKWHNVIHKIYKL